MKKKLKPLPKKAPKDWEDDPNRMDADQSIWDRVDELIERGRLSASQAKKIYRYRTKDLL